MKLSLLLPLLAISLNLNSHTALAQFNELMDDHGNLRPQYEKIYPAWSKISPKKQEQFLIQSKHAFKGDNSLDPLPRILTGAEYDQQLKPGVEQRAKALLAFLQDHYSGKKSYQKANIFPPHVLKRIIQRANESQFENVLNPNDIAFVYGPDIIRDTNGTWRVIEDNPGFIGGFGDLKLAFDYMMQAYPKTLKSEQYRQPMSFYQQLAAGYRNQAQKKGGVAIFLRRTSLNDQEDLRLQKLLESQGIITVTPTTRKQIKVTNKGVYLYDKDENQKLEKVGHITLLGEHYWLEPSHPTTEMQLFAHEIQDQLENESLSKEAKKELIRLFDVIQKTPGKFDREVAINLLQELNIPHKIIATQRAMSMAQNLMSAAYHGQVSLNYTPGVDFIGDKEFYVYVEELIRFYLKEEPIIRNIETQKLAHHDGRLNEVLMKEVFDHLDQYVIKKVDGRGGDAVWVGQKMKSEEISELRSRLELDPQMYIVQKFTPLSTMGDNIVDLRVITDVSHQGILVTDTPWGRGLPRSGNGKVNLSDKGREVTVLVESQRVPYCKWLFK
ncbi:MAG: hypothetical protein BroJett040_04290 [Oligoflexia bacterium]|nr:MAG: hypothetical protein BroJett040_04290 [Oligoflexia bacterium]